MILPVQPLPAVIPAKAGISRRLDEIPAFAGMTENAGMTASAGYDLARDLSPPLGATPSPHPSGGRVREGGRTLPAPLPVLPAPLAAR